MLCPPPTEEKYVTVQPYTSQSKDEIGFEKGVTVEVIDHVSKRPKCRPRTQHTGVNWADPGLGCLGLNPSSTTY